MNPFEEYNYAMESWIVGSHHDSNHLLKQETFTLFHTRRDKKHLPDSQPYYFEN